MCNVKTRGGNNIDGESILVGKNICLSICGVSANSFQCLVFTNLKKSLYINTVYDMFTKS